MPPSRRRPAAGDRERLQALVALKAGGSIYRVAKEAGVSPATIRRWRDQARAVGETFPPAPGTGPDDPGHPQNNAGGSRAWTSPLPPGDVDRHLAIYMGEALEALHVQIALLADREWLQEQSADDVAVAHGVIFDKLSRLAAGVTGATAGANAAAGTAAPQSGRGLPANGPGGVVAERQPGGDGGRPG